LNPRAFLLQEKGASRDIADPPSFRAGKMDGAKSLADTNDMQQTACGREACCEGRSVRVSGCGPSSNEDPAGSSNSDE